MAATTASLANADPALAGLTATVAPVRDVLNEEGRALLVPLFGSVAILFLIACANVANLLLARAGAREREVAIRTVLGARRTRLVRQMLIESLVLGLAGGAAGVEGTQAFAERARVDGATLEFAAAANAMSSRSSGSGTSASQPGASERRRLPVASWYSSTPSANSTSVTTSAVQRALLARAASSPGASIAQARR